MGKFDYGTVTALQVPAEQRHSVVVAVPPVLNHADPLPVGAVPHVEAGAPGPIPIEAPLIEVPGLPGLFGDGKL